MSNVMLNIDKFLEYLECELNRSQRTVESYRDDLKHFEKFARDLSDSFSWETVDADLVRNWMAQKPIPAAKEHIIRELIKQLPLTLPSRVQVEEETLITLKLDPDTRKVLEKKAFSQGKTLKEFLADEVPRLGNPPLA